MHTAPGHILLLKKKYSIILKTKHEVTPITYSWSGLGNRASQILRLGLGLGNIVGRV